MAGEVKTRMDLLRSGWYRHDGKQTFPTLENSQEHPDLCTNCALIMQELARYVGTNGNGTPFTTETQAVQLAWFKVGQHFMIQECRFCRVLQNANPHPLFTDKTLYPESARLSKKCDWGVEKVWQIELAMRSTLRSSGGNLYMVPVLDEKPEPPDITSWVSHANKLDYANVWLQNCKQDHSLCRSSATSYTPNRLIFIGTKAADPIRLVQQAQIISSIRETGYYIPPGVPYATLSHCWGQYKPIQLLYSNINSFLGSIEFDTLSLTFKQAIITARSLGFSYIWIDSLCIIQDSPSDWQEEAMEMALIYRNSQLNIAAAAAVDGRMGLFPPLRERFEQESHSLYQIASNKFRIIDRDHWHNTIESLPLMIRAWVYQERQLAPRNLYFGKDSVAWECDHCRLSETFPFVLPSLKQNEPVPRLQTWHNTCEAIKTGHDLWMSMVTAYTCAHLTFNSDKLIALSGVARRFRSVLRTDKYLAGLWDGDLMNQLLCKEEPYVAPSWSWAQTLCPVKFHAQTFPKGDCILRTKDLADLVESHLEVEWTLGQHNPGTYLVLAAQICKVSFIYNNNTSSRFIDRSTVIFNAFSNFFSQVSFPTLDEDRIGSPVQIHPDSSFGNQERDFPFEDLYCIPLVEHVYDDLEKGEKDLTWTTGLILVRNWKLIEGGGEEGGFRRWGTWRVSFSSLEAGSEDLKSAFEQFNGEDLVPCLPKVGDERKMYQVEIF